MATPPEPRLLVGSSGPWWIMVMLPILIVQLPVSHVSYSRYINLMLSHDFCKYFKFAEVTGCAVGIEGSFRAPEVKGDYVEVSTGSTKRFLCCCLPGVACRYLSLAVAGL